MVDRSTIPSLFIPVSKVRRRQVFYSVRDGNWNDPKIWMSNKYGTIPNQDDDVYINTEVVANVTTTVKNLFVNGTLKATGYPQISVLGNVQANGIIDFTGSNTNLILYGWDNYINTFIKGFSKVTYVNNNYQQVIMQLDYHSLALYDRGTKVLNYDLILSGGFELSNNDFNLGIYDLYVTARSSLGGNPTLRKTGPGSIIFNGDVYEPGYGVTFSFTGNPTVEYAGGWRVLTSTSNFGTGIKSFTKDEFIYSAGNMANITLQNCIIYPDVNVRIMCESYIDGINGLAANSTLTVDRGNTQGAGEFRKTLHFIGVTQPMQTGILDCTTYGSTVSYSRNGDQEVKGTTYDYLILTGSGVKKLMGDVTVPAAKYTLSGTATVDTNGFNLNLI